VLSYGRGTLVVDLIDATFGCGNGDVFARGYAPSKRIARRIAKHVDGVSPLAQHDLGAASHDHHGTLRDRCLHDAAGRLDHTLIR